MKKRILSCFMALALCLTLLPATALAAEPHTHCLCGAKHNSEIKTHAEDTKIPFETKLYSESGTYDWRIQKQQNSSTKLTLTDKQWVLPAGNYYLYDGSEASVFFTEHTIKIQGDVTICLNGKQIKKTKGDATPVFEVPSGFTLTLTDCKTDGKVTCGTTSSDSGSGVYVSGGTFNLYEGQITGNKGQENENTDRCGGGVYVSGGTFNMYGGAITENTASYGGGVYVKSGTFNMNGGTITKNTSDKGGGDGSGGAGVYVNKSGTFNMNAGAISANTATNTDSKNTTYGGGVYVSGGTFTMNGHATSVTGNTATNGGGVYVSSGTFNMNDGKISGNTGNGVFVHNNATFTVSKTPTVTRNTITENGAASNVYLMGSAHITIAGALNGDKGSIGVTVTNSKGVFATGVNQDYSGKFFSDDNTYEVKYEDTQLVLKRIAGQHTHSWSYQKDGDATIKAVCTNTTGDCDVNKNGGSVTINPPANLTQGSNGKTATVTVSDDWQGPAKNKITITYWKSVDGGNIYTNLDGAPTAVGKYKASITVENQTAYVVYDITSGTTGKQEQDALHLASDKNKIAVGETLRLTVTGGSTNGAVTYSITSGDDYAEIKGDVLTAKKAGMVTVTATMKGDETHNDVTSEALTITITEKTGGNTGGSSSGSSSSSGSYDSNPIIKTETKNNPDGSTTKTETRKDGTVTQTTTGKDGSVSKTETKKDGSSVTENKAADGSTGTVKTGKNGQTEANAKVSDKAIENAKKNGKPVKAPVEVEASRNSGTAPTVKVELPQNSGKTEVEIPVSNANAGTVAVLVRPDGTEEILKDSIPTENGIRLTVDGSATVKIVDNSKGFIDTQNHWAKGEIDFVSARELVNGISATRYAPDATATRAQMWTILARQNDADLSGGANWYEKAQLWSKDKGISDGTNPSATITRAQMVTMLWRTMGQPTAAGKVSFADVPAGSYYAQAVAWAVESGITQGVGGNRFDPNATCTRAQIAAFLARSMK